MGENFSVLLNFWGRGYTAFSSGASFFAQSLAWENSPHFATPPLVSPPNDVWENSMQMTRQQPDPIGCSKFPTRQEQSEALPRSRYWHSSVWNFCARFSDVISRGNQWSRNVGCFLRLHRGELETRVKIDGLVRGGGGNIFLSRFILISYKSLRGKLIQECSKVHSFLLQACTVPYLSYCPRLFPSWMLKTACSHSNENYWSAEYTGAYHFTRKRLTSSPQNSISIPLCT